MDRITWPVVTELWVSFEGFPSHWLFWPVVFCYGAALGKKSQWLIGSSGFSRNEMGGRLGRGPSWKLESRSESQLSRLGPNGGPD